MKIVLAASLAIIASVATAQVAPDGKGLILPPATFRVGSDSECDFSSLGDALDAAADRDSILVNVGINFLTNGFAITDKSLTLIGGYRSCAAGTPDPDNRSTITGVALNSVLEITNNLVSPKTVLIRNFTIRGGREDADGGGGVDIRGNVRVRLDNVSVQENESSTGGGVSVRGSGFPASLSLEGGTRIGQISGMFGNTASEEGGGIFCRDAEIEWADATIEFNSADIGAGIYLFNCQLSTPPITDEGPRRILGALNNSANSSGGGIMGVAGSVIILNSSPQRQVTFSGNRSGGSGGGVYVLGSDFVGDGVVVNDNRSEGGGAGVYVSGSSFDMDRGNAGNCADLRRCSQISGNQSESSAGGVFVIGSSADIRQTFMESNVGPNSPVLLATGAGTTVTLRNVQISGNSATNPGNTQLMFGSQAAFEARFVTVAGNDADEIFELDSNSSLALSNSILWEPDMQMVVGDGTQTVTSDCVNASDNATVDAEIHDPGFETDNLNGEPTVYGLSATSANLDNCTGVQVKGMGLAVDAQGRPREVDLPDVPNGAGAQDRGAIERQPPLLSDGFEDL